MDVRIDFGSVSRSPDRPRGRDTAAGQTWRLLSIVWAEFKRPTMPLLDGSERLSSPVAVELSVQPLVVLRRMITNDNLIWFRIHQ
jgi:hypothetical protein